jgi:hypothetical protein
VLNYITHVLTFHSFLKRNNYLSSGTSLSLYQFIRGAIELTALIIKAYHCYQLHTKLHLISYEELHSLYCLPNIIRMIKSRMMRLVGHVACMEEEEEEKKNAYKILVGKLERKRPLGRPRLRWGDNII